MLWDGNRYNVVSEYKNELEALVANELLSPAQPLANLPGSNTGRNSNLQETIAKLTAGIVLQSAMQSPANPTSPLGMNVGMGIITSPYGSMQALLTVPTPRNSHPGAEDLKVGSSVRNENTLIFGCLNALCEQHPTV